MISRSFLSLAASGLLLGCGLFGHSETAHAGNVYSAQLGCYVDTYAYDPQQLGQCGAVWTPGTASNPTFAYFAVAGLSPGNYTYVWTNLENGQTLGCSGSTCQIRIATETMGDGYAALSVRITDLSTGAQKTVSANATYLDGYH